jgi:hypothetical protein
MVGPGCALILMATSLGCGPTRDLRPVETMVAISPASHTSSVVICDDPCGMNSARVARLIQTLRTAPSWRDRDDAAYELRKHDGRCHAEVPVALAWALMTDRDSRVRKEAAESLGRIGCTSPEVHSALDRAARCDPDWCTRLKARKSLRLTACKGDCAASASSIAVEYPAEPFPGGEIPLHQIGPDLLAPPSEMPDEAPMPMPGASSPFSRPTTSNDPLPRTRPEPRPTVARRGLFGRLVGR